MLELTEKELMQLDGGSWMGDFVGGTVAIIASKVLPTLLPEAAPEIATTLVGIGAGLAVTGGAALIVAGGIGLYEALK